MNTTTATRIAKASSTAWVVYTAGRDGARLGTITQDPATGTWTAWKADGAAGTAATRKAAVALLAG